MPVLLIPFSVGFAGGAIASVAGFGIGSLLTPALALYLDTKLAVAAASIPHFLGTGVRCWLLRRDIDRKVLVSFGITSAAGGLAGALAHTVLKSQSLTIIFAAILIFSGSLGTTGLNERMRLSGIWAWLAGLLSGGLGGLVGNQGGIRSAAMLAFNMNKNAFVATATAIGLCVDLARMPVYFYLSFADLARNWHLIAASCAGVLAGTLVGTRFLKRLEEKLFKRIVGFFILALGLWMLVEGLNE